MNRQDDCDCTTAGADGFDDLTLKFDTQAIVAALENIEDGDTVGLTLTAELFDCTLIEGKDCVIIKKKKKQKSGTNGKSALSTVVESFSLAKTIPIHLIQRPPLNMP
ncbi:hypothetical protein IH879_20875 [candidate division KSB1 bacterium]|nr:hypothetical protein [candidate division KSB1 bacterium]